MKIDPTGTRILGIMSGSSLDGCDLALCAFSETPLRWSFEKTLTYSYPKELLTSLKTLSDGSARMLFETEQVYTQFLTACIRDFLRDKTIDAVAVHGHTVFHEPKKGYSLQLLNPWQLYQSVQLPIIHDFRNADIALGGQGAPLVPRADVDLFPDYDAYLNLGGIANITLKHNNGIQGFDIIACNQWLNALSQKLGKAYDNNGDWAKSGHNIVPLADKIAQWDYLHRALPRSLSNQMCQSFFDENIVPFLKSYPPEDLLHTCTQSIAKAIQSHLVGSKKVLVSGGGAHNAYLMQCLGQSIEHADAQRIDFKEALAFAYLGYCKLKGLASNVKEATGASHNVVLGCLYQIIKF